MEKINIFNYAILFNGNEEFTAITNDVVLAKKYIFVKIMYNNDNDADFASQLHKDIENCVDKTNNNDFSIKSTTALNNHFYSDDYRLALNICSPWSGFSVVVGHPENNGYTEFNELDADWYEKEYDKMVKEYNITETFTCK